MILAVTGTTTAPAQTVYINDVIKVTLRGGPGYDHKIVSVLSSGDVVEVIEKGKEWSQARIPDGPSGWVPTRLLSDQEPNVLKIRRLEQQLAALKADDNRPESALKEENRKLQNALAEARFELEAARQARGSVESGGSGSPGDNPSANDAQVKVAELETRLAECQGHANHETLTAGIRWFLAGAGVLLVGMLIGLKSRNRRSGLL